MYIPEFWCGVLATIGVEIVGMIVFAATAIIEGKDDKRKK